MQYCLSCGSMIDEYDSGYYSRSMLCIPCYTRKSSEVAHVSCSRCGIRIRAYESKSKHGEPHCHYCFSEEERREKMPHCQVCKQVVEEWQQVAKGPDGKVVHSSCRDGERRQRIRDATHYTPRPSEEKTIVSSIIGRIESMLA